MLWLTTTGCCGRPLKGFCSKSGSQKRSEKRTSKPSPEGHKILPKWIGWDEGRFRWREVYSAMVSSNRPSRACRRLGLAEHCAREETAGIHTWNWGFKDKGNYKGDKKVTLYRRCSIHRKITKSCFSLNSSQISPLLFLSTGLTVHLPAGLPACPTSKLFSTGN